MSNSQRTLTNQQLMNQAIAALDRAEVRFVKKTGFHLKVGAYNFYPGKGTIYRDGESARPERGLAAFLRLLRKAGLAREGTPVHKVDDAAAFIVCIDEDGEFATR